MDRTFLRSAYNAQADDYDDQFRPLQWPKFEALLGADGARIAGAARVLDAGCGTGLLGAFLRRAGRTPDALFGVDISEGMLRRARTRGVTVVQADVAHLPFPDGQFDAVSSFTVLRIIPSDEERVLREMARVLRPGGRLVLSLLAQRDDDRLVGALSAAGFVVEARLAAGQDVGYLAHRR